MKGLEPADTKRCRCEKVGGKGRPVIGRVQVFPERSRPRLPTIEVVLRDGRDVRLRPIRLKDNKRMEEFFYRLSPDSRYMRYQYAKAYVSPAELAYCTEARPPERCAYVATVGEEERESIVAVGTWDGLPDGRSAETAITVEDSFQLRGLGTILLEQLAICAMRFNYERLVAQVLVENTVMQHVLEQSGFHFARRLEQGAYHYTIDLTRQKEIDRSAAATGRRGRTPAGLVAIDGTGSNGGGENG